MTSRNTGDRTRWRTGRHRWKWQGVVTAIVVAFACGWLVPAAAQDASGTPADTPVASPAADAPRIELEFTELNDSGVTGTAILYEDGDHTIVQLDLDGTGEDHPAHIHEGTCDDIQPEPAYNLENVGEDGASVSLVDAPLQDLIDGDYVIDLHRAPNELGTLIVCAPIEGTPEVPGTGGEDGTVTPEATESATEAATEAPAETEVPTDAPIETEEPTTEPTDVPTEAPTPTPLPTEEPTTVPTEQPTEGGTGGTVETPTPTVIPAGDGTDGGKGVPLSDTGKGETLAVGGASSTGGDGTTGSVDTSSGKGEPAGGTSELPATTGTGSSLIFPNDPSRTLPFAAGTISILLLAAGILTRRGVRTHHR